MRRSPILLTDELSTRINAATDWILRSHAACNFTGSSAYYAPVWGWACPYPETTGYIIPTLCAVTARNRRDDTLQAACRMADWLVSIQSEEGSFPSGIWNQKKRNKPSVFNTAQVVSGLTELAIRTRQDRYRAAAEKAVTWIVACQDADGRWTRHSYLTGYSPSYYSYVCWPLATYATAFVLPRAEEAARRGLRAILEDRTKRNSFVNWSFIPKTAAFTHTIGYTLHGLIEAARTLADESVLSAGATSAETLMRRVELAGGLAGRYNDSWEGDYSFICVVGHFQIALTWLTLYQRTFDPRLLNSAVKLVENAISYQRVRTRNANTRGAIPGSGPFWGRYMRFRYPNWGAKFLIDTFLKLEECISNWSVHGVPSHV